MTTKQPCKPRKRTSMKLTRKECQAVALYRAISAAFERLDTAQRAIFYELAHQRQYEQVLTLLQIPAELRF